MRRALPALLALLLLNSVLSFRNYRPTPGVLPDTRLAPEFLWLWLLLLVLGRRGAAAPSVPGMLAGVYLLLVVLRYADVTVPSLLGRALNVYWDLPQVPRFLWVSLNERPWWQSLAAGAALLLSLWGIHRLLRSAIAVVLRDAVPYVMRTRWTWWPTGIALILVVANYAGVRATWPFISKPVLPTYARQLELIVTAWSPERLAKALPPRTPADDALATHDPQALAALARRDLYLIFLESVGAFVYDDASAARTLAPARTRLAADITAAGFQVVSAFVTSPTIGGGSDLAHVSLLSGIDMSDPRRHHLLLTTQRPTLIDVFRSHGYQTFGLYPAVSWEWPERAWYDYDVYLDGRSLDYRGPPITNWKIPDQFAFARFEELHPRTDAAAPRFVFAGTINTHLPFVPVPPYQPDWQRVLGEAPFDAVDIARVRTERFDWFNMTPGYLRAVEYTYQWLGGYLRLPQPREAVYLLLGDHQAAANVSGEGASWDVPVHIVSRDPQLLARFTTRGFAPGLEPPRAPLGAMHELTGILLDALAASPADSAPADGNTSPRRGSSPDR